MAGTTPQDPPTLDVVEGEVKQLEGRVKSLGGATPSGDKPQDAPPAAVEPDPAPAPSIPAPTSFDPPKAPEVPKTLADLMTAPPEETDDYRTTRWAGRPNYQCKHLRLGNPQVPCPFETLSFERMIEHLCDRGNMHNQPTDNFGNPL